MSIGIYGDPQESYRALQMGAFRSQHSKLLFQVENVFQNVMIQSNLKIESEFDFNVSLNQTFPLQHSRWTIWMAIGSSREILFALVVL